MRKEDPAGLMGRLLSKFVRKQAANLHVAFPCRVVTFNPTTGMANVQPLIRSGTRQTAVIQNVPTLGQKLLINGVETVCKPSLQVGDAVIVVCADREIKNVLKGEFASPTSGRIHDRNDAVIVGVLPCSLF